MIIIAISQLEMKRGKKMGRILLSKKRKESLLFGIVQKGGDETKLLFTAEVGEAKSSPSSSRSTSARVSSSPSSPSSSLKQAGPKSA